jgi:glycosyltransferase involved in cell wall biosynthesis
MRVLAIGNAYPPHHLGGYEIIWRGAMRLLRDAGHQARILTTDYLRSDVETGAAEDPDVHRELEWYWRDHAWRSMTPLQRFGLERRNAVRFDRHVKEFQPDVVTWWPVGGMSLSLIERTRRAGLPSLFFVLDYWPTYGPQQDLWIRAWTRRPRAAELAARLTRVPTRIDLAGAGRWLFCSEAARQETLATTDLRDLDDAILPAGVEDAYLRVPREDEPPPWRWRLLYIGRVVEQKGIRTAIDALPLLPPEAKLRIVGEGDPPYRHQLERRAAELGVSDRVAFEAPKAREELFDVYRDEDAVVFPVEWTEPWGLVPLEAMALGRPVVATGRGGSGDYLEHGVNSLLFEAGNAASLAGALTSLAEDVALRARLRAGGYATAERHSEAAFNQGALAEIELAVQASSRRGPGR